MTSLLLSTMLVLSADATSIQHVNVYYEKGRFGGWPANHGMWSWGNELLVGFSRGYYKDLGPERHNIDRDKPEEHCLARSLDGGETWTIETPNEQGMLLPQGKSLHGTELPGVTIKPSEPSPGGINFGHPDFAMTVRMSNSDTDKSRFYFSYDRGHVWQGPYALPNFGFHGVMARTDYLVDDEGACTLFLTAAKSNEREGRVFSASTINAGKTWERKAVIGPEPEGYSIMPASARLKDGSIVVTIRRRDGDRSWISAYKSTDGGMNFQYLGIPVADTGEGNPPSLIALRDGRLCLTYAYRAAPYAMCAKFSDDGGHTWSEELVLRNDGTTRDIGYPRSVQRPDGKVVVVYYFASPETNPDRYIGATIFTPPATK